MDHALPDSTDAPVIEWSSAGGLGDPGSGGAPDLVVRAGGQVDVGARFGGGQGRIAPERLQALLRSALDEHGFFGLDAQGIDEAVDTARRHRAQGAEGALSIPLGPPYADAGTSRIAIAADGRRHQVARHGLFAAAREYPEVPALGHLRAIESELLALAEEIGGAGDLR